MVQFITLLVFLVLISMFAPSQHFTFRTEDETVVLVLCYVNSNANHDDTSRMKIYDAASTEHFAL